MKDELRAKLEKLSVDAESAVAKLDLANKKKELAELEEAVASPGLWNDPTKAAATTKRLSQIKGQLQPWTVLLTQINDSLDLLDIIDDELVVEFAEQVAALEQTFNELKQQLLFTGKYDAGDAVIRLTAGVGGDDAQDFTAMLERMYLRWAERNGYRAEIISRSPGEEAGVKTSVIEIGGVYAYGWLRSEHGVHRMVRLSPFNSGNTRETSFAQAEVLPKIDAPDEVKIDPKDIRVDIYRASGHGGQGVNTTDSAVRVTHIPTGTVVAIQNERSQIQNKEKALEILRGKLAQMQAEQHAASIGELRAGESASWGNQIRNYVLNPYKLVKDTRTKYEEKDVDSVLSGNIRGFQLAFLETTSGC